MAIVTISKEFAAESEVFAEKLAERLGYSILDKEFIAEAARQLNISETEASILRRGRESRLLRLIDKYTASTIQKVVSRDYGRLDDQNYFEVIKNLVIKAAKQDNVIIVGWGGQCILADHPRAIHVRIVKNIEERIAILKEKLDLDDRGALELIEREETESAKYIEHYFNRSWNDPHLYHLIINLSKLGFEQAVDLVIDLVEGVERNT
ncbi:MAG: cytidylate kinase-like family protein [Deltaproteobacteria bacterium]|nr:cytidylate kinase-like family protein [Deltaproteobacteria bacterium]MBW2068034.1 cytidylate kinase-like family protein [Deltaproteobacteria bacterium]